MEPFSQPSKVRKAQNAVAILIVVNALWGLSFPVVKALSQFLDLRASVDASVATLLYRSTIAGWIIAVRFTFSLALLAVFWSKLWRSASRAQCIAGVCVGLFFYLGLILQIFGLAMIPASRSGFLTSLTTIFTPIISLAVYRQRLSLNIILGCVLALLGVSILTGLMEYDARGFRFAKNALQQWTLGDSLTTLGAFFFSFQVLLVDYFGKRHDTTAITPSMFATTAALGWVTVIVLTSIPSNGDERLHLSIAKLLTISWHPAFGASMLLLSLVCSIFTFGWMNQYQPSISAVQAAVVYSFEPVFATLWAFFVPGLIAITGWFNTPNEVLTSSIFGGGALIMLANAVALWPRRGR